MTKISYNLINANMADKKYVVLTLITVIQYSVVQK